MKWTDMAIPLKNILAILIEYKMLLKLKTNDSNSYAYRNKASMTNTYWLCMAKNGETVNTLDEYNESNSGDKV